MEKRERAAKIQFYENEIISVLRDVARDGVLYKPDQDSYYMTKGWERAIFVAR